MAAVSLRSLPALIVLIFSLNTPRSLVKPRDVKLFDVGCYRG